MLTKFWFRGSGADWALGNKFMKLWDFPDFFFNLLRSKVFSRLATLDWTPIYQDITNKQLRFACGERKICSTIKKSKSLKMLWTWLWVKRRLQLSRLVSTPHPSGPKNCYQEKKFCCRIDSWRSFSSDLETLISKIVGFT